jgi:lipoate-protein ligase A
VKRRLSDAFAREFGVCFAPGQLTPAETGRYRSALAEIDHPDWVHMLNRPAGDMPWLESVRKFSGGLLRTSLTFDAVGRRIKQVWFSGDFFIQPKRVVADLEAWLRDIPLDSLEARIEAFFRDRRVDMMQLTAADFVTAIRAAVDTTPVGSGWQGSGGCPR